MLRTKKLYLGAAALCLGFACLAHADDVKIVSGGAMSSEIHHKAPAIHLTPDKSELLQLDVDAASVMVGNPNHLNVVAESAKTLVLIPKAPGASHFTVLDQKGHVILQRHVIVASPKENYLRIRRTCNGGDEACQTTSMYYCPGMCFEIAMSNPGQETPKKNEEPRPSSNAGYDLKPPQADSEE